MKSWGWNGSINKLGVSKINCNITLLVGFNFLWSFVKLLTSTESINWIKCPFLTLLKYLFVVGKYCLYEIIKPFDLNFILSTTLLTPYSLLLNVSYRNLHLLHIPSVFLTVFLGFFSFRHFCFGLECLSSGWGSASWPFSSFPAVSAWSETNQSTFEKAS